MYTSTSSREPSIRSASLGKRSRKASATAAHCSRAASAVSWAKIVFSRATTAGRCFGCTRASALRIQCTIRTQSTRSVSPRRCRSLERSLRCGAGEVTRAFPEAEMVQAMGPASCRGLAPCRTDHAPERGQPGSSTRCRFVPATARSGWTRLTAVSSTTCRFLFPILDPR